jgi:hypothetical protein
MKEKFPKHNKEQYWKYTAQLRGIFMDTNYFVYS